MQLTWQFNVTVLHLDNVAFFTQLRTVKERTWFTQLSDADKFRAVETRRICKYTTAVDDGNGLIRAEENLICKGRV